MATGNLGEMWAAFDAHISRRLPGDNLQVRSVVNWLKVRTRGLRSSICVRTLSLFTSQRGVRKLDWGDDLVTTGDIYRIKEIRLHCPDGRLAVLEISEPGTAFQFKTKSMNMIGASDSGLEYQVIGRVTDKLSGNCECFIWDYRPKIDGEHLIAYKSNIYHF